MLKCNDYECDWNYKTITQLSYINPYEENNRKFTEKGIQTSSRKKSKSHSKPREPREKHEKTGVKFIENSNKDVKSKPVLESDKNPPVLFDHLIPKIHEKNIDNKIITNEEILLPPPPPLSPKSNSMRIIHRKMQKIEAEILKDSCKFFDHKVTPDLDIPFDQRLYKDLMSLKITKIKRSSSTVHPWRSILTTIPNLEDYYVPDLTNEYSTTTYVPLPRLSAVREYDGRFMHKHMLSWNKIVKFGKYI